MANKADLKEPYEQVVSLYDAAEALMSGVKKTPKNSQEAHFLIINPIVEQLEASADILTEEFIHMAENDSGVPCERSKKNVESTLRKTFEIIDAFFKAAAANKQKELAGIFASAIPLVESAKSQLRRAVGAFLNLVQLSLNKIMPKSEVEKMKQEEPRIAELLHKAAQENSKGRR